jgi:predicted enzyme related to lactoylglutathione lyase
MGIQMTEMTVDSITAPTSVPRATPFPLPPILKHIESVVLFVPDIDAAASWYAEIFGATVQHENPKYAFIQAPGLLVGFHPADAKCPGGIGGTSAYWEVERLDEAIKFLTDRGAKLFRGPGTTDFGATIALLVDPFGCTIGLNQSSEQSRRRIRNEQSRPSQDAAYVPVSRHTRRGT